MPPNVEGGPSRDLKQFIQAEEQNLTTQESFVDKNADCFNLKIEKLPETQQVSPGSLTKVESNRHEQKFHKAISNFNKYARSGANTSIKDNSSKMSPEPHKMKEYVMSTSKSMGFSMSGLKDQDIAGELGNARRKYFERTFGKKIDATLIGEDDLETSHLN